MKIQENYLYLLDGKKEVKVIWKKLDKVCIMEIGKDYPSAIVDEDRLSGIPLTEEWLLKLGFEKTQGCFLKNGIRLLAIRDLYFRGSFPIKTDIKFVHQLQNLYFALTNQEL
jgi:hypothetical protein